MSKGPIASLFVRFVSIFPVSSEAYRLCQYSLFLRRRTVCVNIPCFFGSVPFVSIFPVSSEAYRLCQYSLFLRKRTVCVIARSGATKQSFMDPICRSRKGCSLKFIFDTLLEDDADIMSASF